jgi:hypothetical protein
LVYLQFHQARLSGPSFIIVAPAPAAESEGKSEENAANAAVRGDEAAGERWGRGKNRRQNFALMDRAARAPSIHDRCKAAYGQQLP